MVISCNNDKIYFKIMENIITNDGLSPIVAN